MNSEAYRAERKLRGTQVEVAEKLGVHQVTIARRETNEMPITREAELALLSLPKKRKRQPKNDMRAIEITAPG